MTRIFKYIKINIYIYISILGSNMKNKEGKGPQIWLAGDPDDLKSWLKYGTAGIVTNTVVQ